MSYSPETFTSAYQERTAMELRAREKAFIDFLQAGGATIVDRASEWEVIRYTAWDASQPGKAKRPMTHVIYRKNDGRITFSGRSYLHWNLFIARKPFPDQRPDVVVPVKKKTVSWAKRTRKLLHERDGDDCCICGDPLTHMNGPKQRGPETIEHWLARHLGGTDHIDNLKLAHAKCNRDVGHRTPEEKAEIAAMYKAGLVSRVAHWGVNPRPRKRPGAATGCIGVCRMEGDHCAGCNRTLAQIEEAGRK